MKIEEIVVNEISIEQILDLVELFEGYKGKKEEEKNDFKFLGSLFIGLFESLASIKKEDFLKLKPSELGKIIDKLIEKNKGFLAIAASLGVEDIAQEALKNLKEAFRKEIGKVLLTIKQS